MTKFHQIKSPVALAAFGAFFVPEPLGICLVLAAAIWWLAGIASMINAGRWPQSEARKRSAQPVRALRGRNNSNTLDPNSNGSRGFPTGTHLLEKQQDVLPPNLMGGLMRRSPNADNAEITTSTRQIRTEGSELGQ